MSLQGNERIRNFMDKLTSSTKVSEYVDLPMIAVMGDTSSGKSSLLSSISAIELPSASTLTTRCPIRLVMKNGKTKLAEVNVQWKGAPSNKTAKELAFETKVITESEWDLLPDAISEAQQHIVGLSGKEVASDVVEVRIQSPHCEDLTLVDLPGIVRTTGKDESATLGEDIKILIDDYLRNTRCIILAVVPANVDFHNSQIMNEAFRVDPDTKRTIPVITKPDLIDPGAENDVLELLQGKKTNKFHYGFHMVKNRGQKALDEKQTIEDGLANEKRFFETTIPWKDEKERSLFGTVELRRKLGELQLNLMRKTMPAIIQEIRDKCEAASKELVNMGTRHVSIQEKRYFFSNVVDSLCKRLKEDLVGSGSNFSGSNTGKSSAAAFHDFCEDFKHSLNEGMLKNISRIQKGDRIVARLQNREVKGEVAETKDGEVILDYDGRLEECDSNLVYNYGYRSSEKDPHWYQGYFAIPAKQIGVFHLLKPIPQELVRRDQEWLVEMIRLHRPYELPIFPNTVVFNKLVALFIEEDWKGPSHRLVEDAKQLLRDAAKKAISSLDETRRYERLNNFLSGIAMNVMERVFQATRVDVDRFIESEQKPYTQDHYVFENISKSSNKWLLCGINRALGTNDEASVTVGAVKEIIRAEFMKNQEKSIDQHMAEHMENALDGYGKVTFKRFVDDVPKLCWESIKKFPDNLADHLRRETPDDKIADLLSHSPEFEKRFAELTRQTEELEVALKILEELL